MRSREAILAPTNAQAALTRALRLHAFVLTFAFGTVMVLFQLEAARNEVWSRAWQLSASLAPLGGELEEPATIERMEWLAEVTDLRAVSVHDGGGRLVSAYLLPGAEDPPVPGSFREGQLRKGNTLRSVRRLTAEEFPELDSRWLTVDTELTALARREGEILGNAGLAALAILALAIGMSPWSARPIVQPITRLARQACALLPQMDPPRIKREGEWIELACMEAALRELVHEVENHENLLEEQAENLERQVRMRTAELVGMNREIAHARAMAEEAVRTRSAFLAMMSHELRTPLNAVIGISSLLSEMPLDKEAHELAERIERSGHRLLSIVGDVLDFSKIDAGKLELEEVRFDPREPVEAACELMVHSVREKGLELVTFVEPDLPTVLGDPGRLQQIVLNYLGNALKFTREGHVAVELTARAPSLDAVELTLVVEDTGIGVPEERRSELFESFQQAEASIARRYGGTGLGLAITRRLAELMNGTVGFKSEVGVGSVFWCQVVLARAAMQSEDRVLPEDMTERRVVLAERNATLREGLVRQLEAFGLEAVACSSASGLVRELEHPSAFILLDPHFPGAGEALRRASAQGLAIVGLREPMPGAPDECYLELPIREDHWRGMLRGISGEETSSSEADHKKDREGEKRPERILLAEDNETNQALTRYLLAQRGFELDWAENGELAVRMFQERNYALVLMDCQMPVLDGFGATRALRAYEQESGRRRVPVLAMSANIASEARSRCLAAGMDDFLAKPIDPDHVLSTVEAWIERSQGGAVSEPAPLAALPAVSSEEVEGKVEVMEGQASTPSGMDRRVLDDLLDGGDVGRELAVDLMRSFLAARQQFEDLEEWYDEGRLAECARRAHKLVSTSGNVGALELARVLRRVESALSVDAPEAEACRALLESVQHEVEQVARAVDGILSEIEAA